MSHDGLEVPAIGSHFRIGSATRRKGNAYSMPLRSRCEFNVLMVRVHGLVHTLRVPSNEVRIWLRAGWKRTW